MPRPCHIRGIRRCRTLVLGLGNTILSDDGVGIYVVREIGKRVCFPFVSFQEASVGGLELLDLMAGFERVILIDAVLTQRNKAGTLVPMKVQDVNGGSAMARHQVGLYEALVLGRKLKMNLPARISLYGIEIKDNRTFGESCTADVAAAIPGIVKTIIRRERLLPIDGKRAKTETKNA